MDAEDFAFDKVIEFGFAVGAGGDDIFLIWADVEGENFGVYISEEVEEGGLALGCVVEVYFSWAVLFVEL